MNRSISICLIATFLVLSLVACGGGGGSGGSGSGNDLPPPQATDAVGVWQTTSGGTFKDEVLIVAQGNQEARLMINGWQFVFGEISGVGGSISATITAFADVSAPFLDGGYTTMGTLTGTVVEGVSFRADYSLNSGDTGTFDLEYDSLTDFGSAIDNIVGCWTMLTGPCEFKIDPDGSFVGRIVDFIDTQCLWTGNVSIIDSRYNIYRITYTVSGCPAFQSDLHGDYSGLFFKCCYPGNTFENLHVFADDGQRIAPDPDVFR